MLEADMPVTEILERAIAFEEEAHEFYTGASQMVDLPHVRDLLDGLAGEEIKHKHRLEELMAGDLRRVVAAGQERQIVDLKIADYLASRPLDKTASFQDVLIVAMQREKSAHDFYSRMAEVAGEQDIQQLFQFLAQEELVHKNKVETIYDEVVYQEF
jgi:rubrerythrin